ncbi:unnamed protein product, partial [Prunus brigantina]
NLEAWYSGPRGCARTRDVLLLDAVLLCAGVPARSTVRRDGDGWWWILSGAPVRCSESDGRMIYGVNEAITGMMLRRLEKSRLSIYRRSPGGPIEAEKDLPEGPKISAWWIKSAFRIVKHGGV